MASQNLLTTIAWGISREKGDEVVYALEGSIFIAGAAVQWLRDELGIISTAAESQELAMSVPESNGVYIVPAFVGLGAPHWDPNARGAIFGLTRGANRAHLARATLEAIAFQTCDIIEAIEADSGVTLSELRVDGGAAANDLLLQIQADLLGRDVVRPAEPADRMARRIDSPQHADSITAARAVPPWERLDDSRRSVVGAGRLPEQLGHHHAVAVLEHVQGQQLAGEQHRSEREHHELADARLVVPAVRHRGQLARARYALAVVSAATRAPAPVWCFRQ